MFLFFLIFLINFKKTIALCLLLWYTKYSFRMEQYYNPVKGGQIHEI